MKVIPLNLKFVQISQCMSDRTLLFLKNTTTGAVYFDMLDIFSLSHKYMMDKLSSKPGHFLITGHRSSNPSISILQKGRSVAVAPFYGPLDHHI
jgi:hypothetical protein